MNKKKLKSAICALNCRPKWTVLSPVDDIQQELNDRHEENK